MKNLSVIILLSVFALSCRPDKKIEEFPSKPSVPTTPIEFAVPAGFPPPKLPSDNPLTKEGVRLGRHLFYEKRLSGDNTMSCGSCHNQEFSFTDNGNALSTGITGAIGELSSMPIFNLAWQDFFFWDGRASSLEEQAIEPVENPIEMHSTWPEAISKLEKDPMYEKLFSEAFGPNSISRDNAVKAIAQFERMLISGNSKYDQFVRGETNLSQIELDGLALFNDETGDCFHCHSYELHGAQFGAFGQPREVFKNNGLDSMLTPGFGREGVTGNSSDRNKVKVPSLRNISFSFPYMHDGRFQSLDEVIEFYNMGGHKTETIDPNMKAAGIGRNWTPYQKQAIKAFLETLNDYEFLTDTAFSDPFQ